MPKILIVDDDITITELMKVLVTMEGHQPTTVNDSTKAIEVAGWAPGAVPAPRG